MANNNRGLGRGIEALFADNHINTGEAVIHVSLNQLTPNPYQPRTNFDRHSLEELAHSIEEDGVFQPIIVRKSTKKPGFYEILAGERRYRASKMAGKDTIPAIVRDATNEQMMEIAVLENLQREDLTPLEEARAYYTLMHQLHLTQAQVSSRLGKSRPYIANYLRLLKLPKEVKAMLQSRKLSMAKARALLAVSNKQKMIKIAKKACQKDLTMRQIREMINRSQPKVHKRRSHKKPVKSPFLRAIEDQLQDKFGTKVNIHDRRGSHGQRGKIEISFISGRDLNRILKLLHINLD